MPMGAMSIDKNIDNAFGIHSILAFAGAAPIVGALVVSPLHFLISAVECVAGAALFALAKGYNACFKSHASHKFAQNCAAHAFIGAGGMIFSLGNVLTLGGLAFFKLYKDSH